MSIPTDYNIKSYRKSFEEPFSKDEEEVILAVSYQLKLIGFAVPEWWTEADTLRCAQATHYELEPALEYIKRSVKWFNLNYAFEPKPQGKRLIKGHICYITGVTVKEEPIIFIDGEKTESMMNDFSELFIFFMFLTREKMHLRGYIETNIIVFDLCKKNSFICGKVVKLVLDILERSFYGFTSKIYFFNTGTSMKYHIRTLSNSLHPVTKQIIEIVEPTNNEEVIRLIGKHNLPKNLGGSYDRKDSFPWPIATPVKEGPRLTLDFLKKIKIQPYYFCEDFFKAEWHDIKCFDDINSVFSEVSLLQNRLRAVNGMHEAEVKMTGIRKIMHSMLKFNCCGPRSKN